MTQGKRPDQYQFSANVTGQDGVQWNCIERDELIQYLKVNDMDTILSKKMSKEEQKGNFPKPMLPVGVGSQTKYQIVYADPPWSYPESGSKAKVHDRHYKCMSLDEICNLPIKDITHENCLLFLWVTMPRLFDAQKVITSWGFQYKTVAFNWVKENKRAVNKSLFDETPIDDFLGLGSWTRSNSEICLLAVKGSPKKQSSSVRQLVVTPIEKHSKKPDCVRDMIIELCGNIPRIELFARQNVDGWDAWGNEVSESIELETFANNG